MGMLGRRGASAAGAAARGLGEGDFVKRAVGCAVAALLAGTCCMAPALAGAATLGADDAVYTKDQSVYGVLAGNGLLESLYVVNQFDVEEAGSITDYGEYDAVENLTNDEAIAVDDDEQTFDVEQGMFYYQGRIDVAELPWDISIIYLLDGRAVLPEKLAGAEGDVEVRIAITPNEEASTTFTDHYLLQVSFTVPADACDDIDVGDAGTVSDAGANRQITYTVMPGSSAELVFSAEATDFEMSAVQIAGTAYTASAGSDMDPSSLADGAQGYADSMQGLADGATGVSDGVAALSEGSTGLNETAASVASEAAAVSQALAGIDTTYFDEQTAATLEGLKAQSAALAEAGAGLQQGVGDYTGGVDGLVDGAGQVASGLGKMADGAAALPDSIQEALGGMAGGEFVPEDFVSARNENTEQVQFVLTTRAIEIPTDDAPVEEEEQPGFLDRVQALLGGDDADDGGTES